MKNAYNIRSKSERCAILLFSIYLLGTLLFSYGFLMEHAHHECSGVDCEICMELELAFHNISSHLVITSVVTIVLALLCVNTQCITDIDNKLYTYKTLIKLKVELQN